MCTKVDVHLHLILVYI